MRHGWVPRAATCSARARWLPRSRSTEMPWTWQAQYNARLNNHSCIDTHWASYRRRRCPRTFREEEGESGAYPQNNGPPDSHCHCATAGHLGKPAGSGYQCEAERGHLAGHYRHPFAYQLHRRLKRGRTHCLAVFAGFTGLCPRGYRVQHLPGLLRSGRQARASVWLVYTGHGLVHPS